MFCIHCGKEIADDSQFCGFCGKSQAQNAQPDASSTNSMPPQTPVSHPSVDRRPKQKSKLPLIAGIAVAVIAIIAAVIFLSGKSGSTKTAATDSFLDFQIGGKTFTLGKSTLNDVQKAIGNVDQDMLELGMVFSEDSGMAFMSIADNGIVDMVTSESPDVSFYQGVKVGMSKQELEKRLDSPSVTEGSSKDAWTYDRTGKLLSEANSSEAVCIIIVEYETGSTVTTLGAQYYEDGLEAAYGGDWDFGDSLDYGSTADNSSAATPSANVPSTPESTAKNGQNYPSWCSGVYYGEDGASELSFSDSSTPISFELYLDGIGFFDCTGNELSHPDTLWESQVSFASSDGSFKGILSYSASGGEPWVELEVTLADFVLNRYGKISFYRTCSSDDQAADSSIVDSPYNDFTVYGYTYSEAIEQGWSDTFEEIANQMGSEGIDPMSRFMWFIEDCDKTYFTRDDLDGFDKEMAMLARNAPYAHEGRMFSNETIQEFFWNWKWYDGYIAPDSFQESALNEYEKANKELVMAYEKEMGYK